MAGIGLAFQIKGASEISKKLKKETITQPLAEGIKKLTLFLDREVKVATPVDTDRLRSSITSQVTAEFGKVGTNVNYATFVEYGTKKMSSRHVTEGSSIRIKEKGMFAFGLEKVKEKLGKFMADIGVAIEQRWNK